MVTSETWPDEKLKVAGETIDPKTIGKVCEYCKMPLLSVQFRDNAVWKVTLRPMEAGPKPHTLKVHFTVDGEKVHERVIPGIVFGDVWCVPVCTCLSVGQVVDIEQ